MTEYTSVAIDTSKHVFTLHAVCAAGQVFRRELRRGQVEAFFAQLAPARSRWRPAAGRITGAGCCRGLATACG